MADILARLIAIIALATSMLCLTIIGTLSTDGTFHQHLQWTYGAVVSPVSHFTTLNLDVPLLFDIQIFAIGYNGVLAVGRQVDIQHIKMSLYDSDTGIMETSCLGPQIPPYLLMCLYGSNRLHCGACRLVSKIADPTNMFLYRHIQYWYPVDTQSITHTTRYYIIISQHNVICCDIMLRISFVI